MIPRLLLAVFLWFAPAASGQPADAAAVDPSDDSRIKARLETIFGHVDELERVEVEVKNGVVRLAGPTPGEESKEKAESVAAGLAGVIYVDNDIVPSTDVTERLSPSLKRLNDLVDTVRGQLPLLGVAAVVLVVFWLLSRLAGRIFERLRLIRSNLLLRTIAGNLIRVVVMLAGIYLALETVGATAVVGAVLGAAGVAGLAISFAFRDIIENYLASVILSIRQPFRIKDRVEINGHLGRVMRLTSSETVLMTDDGNHVRLPNSDVFKGIITNYTRNPRRRLSVAVGIGTGEDLDLAESVGLATLRELPGIMEDPAPAFRVTALGDSNVNVLFHAWLDQRDHDYLKVHSLAVRRVKDALDAAGIEMPAPIHQVHLQRRPKEQAATREPPALPETADLSPQDPIAEEIDEEQKADPGENLLDG